MDLEENPVKEFLFDHIRDSSNRFSHLISQQKFGDIVNDIMTCCYDKAAQARDREESIGVLATGILHYLLTSALIPSQRKVVLRGTKIDIVVPDLKTLQAEPKKALIICIPSTLDRNTIKAKLEQLQKIQPERQNIWLALSENLELENKTYVISKNSTAFSRIIYDISQFANVQGHNRFRILRA